MEALHHDKGNPAARRVNAKPRASRWKGRQPGYRMVGCVENNKRPTLQEQQVVPAPEIAAVLESLGALESLLDALTAKVDDLDRRLCVAESRLEKFVAGRD